MKYTHDYSLVLFLVFTMVASVGCSPETVTEASERAPGFTPVFEINYTYGVPSRAEKAVTEWGNLEGQARDRAMILSQQRMGAATEAYAEIGSALESRSTPTGEKLRLAKEVIEKHKGSEYSYLLEQLIALQLMYDVYKTEQPEATSLSRIDVNSPFSKTSVSSLEYATHLMVANKTPHAPTVATNLKVLKNYLPAETLHTYARQALESASRWMDERGGCSECILRRDQAAKAMGFQHSEAVNQEMSNALAELAILAGK